MTRSSPFRVCGETTPTADLACAHIPFLSQHCELHWILKLPKSEPLQYLIMSASKIPEGKTWFDTHKVNFQDVPINDNKEIDTDTFLDAAESTTTLFGKYPCVA